MTTYADLKRWDGAALTKAGTDLEADVKKLERAADEVREQAVPDSWQGLARIVAQARQSSLVSRMDTHTAGVRTLLGVVQAAADDVTRLTEDVGHLETDAKGQEFTIGGDGTVTDVATPPELVSVTAAEHYTEGRITQRDALVDRVADLLERGHRIDRSLVQAMPDEALGEEAPIGVDPEVRDTWASMSEEERRRVLEQMVRDITDGYGIDDIDVVIDDLEDEDGDGVDDDPSTDLHGYYNDGVLHLDANELDDPDLINTAAHEVRHGLQHRLVDDAGVEWEDVVFGPIVGPAVDDDAPLPPGVTPDDVESWADNFDDYQDSGTDGFDNYYNQPVEQDAREAGRDYLEGLTPEELAELREEAS